MSLVGKILHDTYRIDGKLGAGGMGDVYRGSHLRFGRKLAIKVLRSSVESEEAFARFRHEAEITGELGHPNIVQTLDFNQTDDGAPYIVMELLEGEDLATRLKREGRMDVDTALRIVEQIGAALSAAHARSIVHRDLKPQNVFLCQQEDGSDFVKVLDFGISKVHGSRSVVTQSRAVIGTPKYMAPEQAQGWSGSADARADQFALATMLYEMLTGESPFEADSVPSVLYKVVHHEPPNVKGLAPALDEEVAAALMRGLAKEREDRYASVTAFVAALHGRPAPTGELARGPGGASLSAEGAGGSAALAATTPAESLASAPTALGDGNVATRDVGTLTSATRAGTSPPANERSRWLSTALLAVVVLSAGAVAWRMLGRDSEPPVSSFAGPSDVGTAAPTSSPAAPADATFAVALRFESSPPADRILVDGKQLADNAIELPAGTRYRLRAEKAGYLPRTLELVAEESGSIAIELEPTATPRQGSATRAVKKPRKPTTKTPIDAHPAPPEKGDDGKFITDF